MNKFKAEEALEDYCSMGRFDKAIQSIPQGVEAGVDIKAIVETMVSGGGGFAVVDEDCFLRLRDLMDPDKIVVLLGNLGAQDEILGNGGSLIEMGVSNEILESLS